MKKTKSFISTLLLWAFNFLLFESQDAKVIKFNGYQTWTLPSSYTFLSKINNSGKNTNIQGMNVGSTYIYNAKISSSTNNVVFFRTNIDTKKTEQMTCTGCENAGHANDLCVTRDVNDKYHILVTTSNTEKAIASYSLSGTKMTFTGYLDLVYTYTKDGKQVKEKIYTSSIMIYRHDKTNAGNEVFYMIFKKGETLYHGRIYDRHLNGNKNTPTAVSIYKLAILDKKNAVIVKNGDFDRNYRNLEYWVDQGVSINSKEKTFYAPLFEPNMDNSGINTNVILMYNGASVLKNSIIDAQKDNLVNNKLPILFPTVTTFLLKGTDIGLKNMEVESCGFRDQTEDGDRKLYFSANTNPDTTYEGIFSMNYYGKNGSKAGSGNYTSVFDASKKYFTVHYDGGESTVKDEAPHNTSYGYNRMTNTRHVYGVLTNLRNCTFTNGKKKFNGWILKRKSDNKKLYTYTLNGETKKKWCTDAEHANGLSECKNLAIYNNRQAVSELSSVNEDTVTVTAQWK